MTAKLQTIPEAAAVLLADQALAYPTETYYGLGCAALSTTALDHLATWKPRDPVAKPYPLILGAASQLSLVSPEDAISPLAQALMSACWPGPLTLVLRGLDGLDPRICSPVGGVAVRVSSHETARELALAIEQPLVSTSANPPGGPPPKHPDDVSAAFAPRDIPVLDGGECAGGAPSTILSLLEESPQMLRPGAISVSQLLAIDELKPWRDVLAALQTAS